MKLPTKFLKKKVLLSPEEEDRDQFDFLYKDFFQHTRQWMLSGYTPAEIEKMELERESVKHSIKMNKMVTINDIKAIKRIDRYDQSFLRLKLSRPMTLFYKVVQVIF